MRRASILPSSLWQGLHYRTCRFASSQPPGPRAYKPAAPEERISRHPPLPEEPAPEPKKGILSRIWPRPGTRAQHVEPEARNPARGMEAAQRVVREGVLDPRYRPAARRVTALLCALPIAIGLGYELFRRRFLGGEQRKIPRRRTHGEGESTT